MKHSSCLTVLLRYCSACVLLLVALKTVQGGTASPAPDPLPRAPLHQLTIAQLEEVIASISLRRTTIADKIAAYSELAVGTPYASDSLGEGSSGTCDRDPLMDLSRADCVTFCEQILALSISRNYEEAFRNLQRIRYRKGVIGFSTRNHFVMADWLPNNQWLLRDITGEAGGPLCREMTKIIDRKSLALARGCAEDGDGLLPQRMSIRYLPTQHLPLMAAKLQGSNILVFITAREGVFASHLGFIIKTGNGDMCFRHASSLHKKVVDESVEHVVRRLEGDRQICGFVLIEPREDIPQPPVKAAP